MTAEQVRRCGQGSFDSPLAAKLIADLPPGMDAGGQLEQIGRMLGRRLDVEPESAERITAQVVITMVDLVRQAMEREALSRIEELPADQVERMGQTLLRMDRRIGELCETFGLTRDDVTRGIARLARLA